MSGKLMGELFKRQLTQTQLVVALALADHAKDDGTDVFPGVGYVAWKVDKSRRQVRRIMRELEALGMLVKVADAQRHRPTEYSIDVEALEAKPPPPDKRDPRSQGGHSCVTPKNVQGGHSCVTPKNDPGVTSGASRADISEIQGGHSCVRQGGHPDVPLIVSKPSLKPFKPPTTSPVDVACLREGLELEEELEMEDQPPAAALETGDLEVTSGPADADLAEQQRMTAFEQWRDAHGQGNVLRDWEQFEAEAKA
jgi:Helix-turn-helix domain